MRSEPCASPSCAARPKVNRTARLVSRCGSAHYPNSQAVQLGFGGVDKWGEETQRCDTSPLDDKTQMHFHQMITLWSDDIHAARYMQLLSRQPSFDNVDLVDAAARLFGQLVHFDATKCGKTWHFHFQRPVSNLTGEMAKATRQYS